MIDTLGYALREAHGELSPFAFQRRAPDANDIVLDVLYCGICHSDLLSAHDGLKRSIFPMVPGHEIVGRVSAIGSAVSKHRVGELVGVGCIIDSCRVCAPCREHDEHYCVERFTPSFNGRERGTGNPTYGGYSQTYVINEHYAVKIPGGLDPAAAAPLLCGGITTYLPLKRFLETKGAVGKGQRVGVVGLGGLGHLAIKFAKAFGAEPVMLTSSPGKVGDAQKLGAVDVILTSDAAQMARAMGSLDFILDTVSAPHDPNIYLALLKRNGTMCLVGVPEQPLTVQPMALVWGDKALSGSLIGGIQATQEMLDFCAEHGIAADIEMIAMQDVNTAWDRMERNDVKYRFVIDMATLK
ncbi:MAG: NAD(P)-dependent alcohol dehydrogenase [Spongiibacteraceae bacterium]